MLNRIEQELADLGITNVKEIVRNPSYEQLFEEEMKSDLKGYEKGVLTNLGAVAVDTGIFTGRSPKDKYIVLDETTKDTVWWTSDAAKNDNKPMTQSTWQSLKTLVTDELSNKRLFIIDAFCGASPEHRINVRIITQVAWQAHFVKKYVYSSNRRRIKRFQTGFCGNERFPSN